MSVVTPVAETAAMYGWQYGKSFMDCIHHRFISETATDVCFQVKSPDGSGVTPVKAHKLILISRSAFFEKLFTEPTSDIFKIKDIDLAVFKEVLR